MRLSNGTSMTVVLVAALFLNACGSKDKSVKDTYDMGDKVKVGGLTYTVLETKWMNQLGEYPAPRTPQRNFLLVRMAISNSASSERIVPGLTIENSSGDSYPESQDGRGVVNWLGLLRRIAPNSTEDGWVVFDVPTNSYRLRVTDTIDDGGEQAALISMPLHLDDKMENQNPMAPLGTK